MKLTTLAIETPRLHPNLLYKYFLYIAIKVSKGITDRVSIKNIIMQGTVSAGIKFTTSIDKLSKIAYENKPLLYIYKGVDVPPLGMVDDTLSISKCSAQSTAINATINTFVESKKLTLKQNTCSVIHVGKESVCPELRVHDNKIHKEDSGTYLGNIIHKSGKVSHNISQRCIKAFSILAEIREIMQDVPLGKYKVKIGLQLRQAMFLNGVLYGWNQPGREKAKKMGILPFTYWVLLTTFIFLALLEIVMCLKHIEASHIMAFNS